MSERSKYAINGVYKCEGFEQNLATGQFPEHDIGYSPCASRVYITLKIREEYNQVYPYIVFERDRKRKIRAFFNNKSKFWSLCYQTNGSIYLESGDGVSGPSINIQDVLNEENGYLENGALTVEYGFQIDAILGYHNFWYFNLTSQLFNSEKENNTIIVKHRWSLRGYHSPKPLLVFHSSLFGHETKKIFLEDEVDEYYAYRCLQIANGVRLQLHSYQDYEWFNIAEVGQKMKMMNVVHYCETIIIRTIPNALEDIYKLKRAIKLNMRHSASRMIRLWNLKDLLEEVEDYLDEVPGEMMKVITRKFINEEF
ncbi:unnamed protein product [Caenorhabditis brenneri]